VGLRMTPQEAVQRGLLSKEEAKLLQNTPKRGDPRTKYQRAVAEDSPQAILQRLLVERWGDLAVPEYKGAVPGRRFRLDVGFAHVRLGVECDGWEWHGKHKGDFKRDRERDKLLLLNGWRVLRFYASEIKQRPAEVLDMVEKVIAVIEQEKVS